jgi:1,2-diacylglycerol-3-alpha-glucose alpha-1,2-galactosyltransferase
MSSEAIQYINQYGYIAIFVLIFLQEIGVPNPVPNELVLLFSGYLTFTGTLFLPFVLMSAIAADLIGATILYYVFYFFGTYILSHKPKWFPISTEKINKLSQKINAGGFWALFLGRITPFIRGYVSVISGLIQIKPRVYLPLILITALLVCGTYIITGRLLGPYWSDVAIEAAKTKYYLVATAATIAIWMLIRNLKRAKINKFTGAGNLNAIEEKKRSPLIIHIVSETAYITKGQGVHTAFVNLVELLKEKDDIKVVVNNEGYGDVFHSHTYGPYYFRKGRRYKGSRIHTVHVIPDSIKGSIPMWKYLFPLAKAYFKMAYSYADLLIALSPMVEKAIRDLGVKTPVVKIYNPILIEHWQRTPENRRKGRELLGLSENETVILGVGQLQERKGVEDFIDIGEAIPGAKFIWVGGRPFGMFTEGITRINKRIEQASENIRFPGMFDLADMPAIYAAADIFLFPSYQENCPLAPLEAAACQMPVIYRDLEEYILLYDSPYLKAADIDDFISLTKKLINDNDFYAEALKVSACLIKQFDKDKIRAEIIALYYSVYCKTNFKDN